MNARHEHTIVISYVQIHMDRLHVLVCQDTHYKVTKEHVQVFLIK